MTTTPTPSTQAYGETSYWENRYANESGPFDWYQKYPSLAPLINLYVPRNARVLIVGCGNSTFSEGMADDNYGDVVSVDISSVVIDAMREKYSDRPELKFLKMDVRDMSDFESGSFDAVVDKGTLDSILCGNDSRQNSSMMLQEVGRVLKDKGVYILVTYGAPIYRLRLLKELHSWSMKLHVIEKFLTEGGAEPLKWDLAKPIPLDDEGSSAESLLGKNPDVHYIYVCTKVESTKPGQEQDVKDEN